MQQLFQSQDVSPFPRPDSCLCPLASSRLTHLLRPGRVTFDQRDRILENIINHLLSTIQQSPFWFLTRPIVENLYDDQGRMLSDKV